MSIEDLFKKKKTFKNLTDAKPFNSIQHEKKCISSSYVWKIYWCRSFWKKLLISTLREEILRSKSGLFNWEFLWNIQFSSWIWNELGYWTTTKKRM